MLDLKKDLFGRDKGFIVPLSFIVFYILERVSVFYWVRRIGVKIHELNKRRRNTEHNDNESKAFVSTYIFPEIWVVANILLALISRSVVQSSTERWITIILCIYAIERTFEMLVYQINVLFFHRLKNDFLETQGQNNGGTSTQTYQIKSATRTVILLIFNMIEYILQFSVIFSALGSLLQNQQMHLNTFDSFLIFMNLDDLNRFSGNFVMNIAFYETLIGLFMNILCIGYFIGMLPQNNNINNNDNDNDNDKK